MKISDFPFENKSKPENVSSALAWLETASPIDTAHYAIFDRKGGCFPRAGVCHVGLQSHVGEIDCVAFYCADRIDLTNNAYWKWLTEESFAARFVLGKNDKGFVLSPDLPADLVQNIAIMARHLREVLPLVRTFNYAVSKGLPGNAVYPLMNTKNSSSFEDQLTWPVRCANLGHRAWRLFTTERWAKFVNGDFGKRLDERAATGDHYRTRRELEGGRLYCDMSNAELRLGAKHPTLFSELHENRAFVKALRDFRQSVNYQEGVKIFNPFTATARPVQVNPGEVTYKEAIDFVLPWCISEGVFNVNQQ